MTLKERIKWIIIDVIDRNNLSNIKLAEKLGCDKGTINNYRRQKSVPSADFIENFCEKFSVNPTWIITGQGEQYIKEGEEPQAPITYPKVERPDLSHVEAPGEKYKSREGFKIADALMMTTRVLESGTSYAAALFLNIQHFDRAIRREKQVAELIEENRLSAKKIQQLEERLVALEKRMINPSPGSAGAAIENKAI